MKVSIFSSSSHYAYYIYACILDFTIVTIVAIFTKMFVKKKISLHDLISPTCNSEWHMKYNLCKKLPNPLRRKCLIFLTGKHMNICLSILTSIFRCKILILIYQFYFYFFRNEEMTNVNWITDNRMFLFIFVSSFVSFSMAGLQLWHLKSFFKKNKLL
jgi:hypothetical protein